MGQLDKILSVSMEMFVLCVSDYSSDVTEPLAKKAKKSIREANIEVFYKEMVASIKRNMPSIVDTESININDLPDDKVELMDTLSKYKEKIDDYQRNGTVYYSKLGHILAVLKSKYIEKCDNCSSLPHIELYEGINCKSCKHDKKYSSDVKQRLDYSTSHINYLIKVSELYIKFQNFKYCKFSSDKLKNYMSCIRKKMETDPVWRDNIAP